MSICTKRLVLEYNNLKKKEERAKQSGTELDFRVWTVGDNMQHWGAKIRGPPDTPFENGIYLLDIQFPTKYPFSPPHVKFVTKMFHPNVSTSNGEICLDILKSGKWSAALKVEKVLLSLISFLVDPNPDDPLASSVARVYRESRQKYDETVQKYKTDYCCKSWEGDK